MNIIPKRQNSFWRKPAIRTDFPHRLLLRTIRCQKDRCFVIQEYMADIGIDMQLNLSEFATFLDDVRNGRHDMWFLVNGDGYRGDQWLTSFTSEKIPEATGVSSETRSLMNLWQRALKQRKGPTKINILEMPRKFFVESIPSIPDCGINGRYPC